ncbi:hypothetical protein TNCV_1069951 [Trichonephila clavipes]|nr:hypothetical protein TNCV_1069951 [Trichonephila clavipes]
MASGSYLTPNYSGSQSNRQNQKNMLSGVLEYDTRMLAFRPWTSPPFTLKRSCVYQRKRLWRRFLLLHAYPLTTGANKFISESEDVQELLDSHNQELTMDELIEFMSKSKTLKNLSVDTFQ